MKKAIGLAGAFLLLLIVLLAGCAEPTEPESSGPEDSEQEIIYSQACIADYTEERLIDDAKQIVRGTVVRVEHPMLVHEEGEPPQADTYAYIRVEESLKGTFLKGDTVIVFFWGDGKTVIDSEMRRWGGYPQQGEELVLFLDKNDTEDDAWFKRFNPERYAIDKTGPYLFNYQGLFRVDASGNIRHDLNQSPLAKFRDRETYDELAQAIRDRLAAGSGSASE